MRVFQNYCIQIILGGIYTESCSDINYVLIIKCVETILLLMFVCLIICLIEVRSWECCNPRRNGDS